MSRWKRPLCWLLGHDDDYAGLFGVTVVPHGPFCWRCGKVTSWRKFNR